MITQQNKKSTTETNIIETVSIKKSKDFITRVISNIKSNTNINTNNKLGKRKKDEIKNRTLPLLEKARQGKNYNEKTTEKKSDRFKKCGTELGFVNSIHSNDPQLNKSRLVSGNFCGFIFCSLCNYLKMLKDIEKIKYSYNENKYKYNFIFVTLNVPNFNYYDLEKGIKNISTAWTYFIRRPFIKSWFGKNYLRKVEITLSKTKGYIGNVKTLDCWNVHMHILIAIEKEKKYKRDWEKVMSEWKKCYGWSDHDYKKVSAKKTITCYLQKFNPKKGIAEIAKYISKEIIDIASSKEKTKTTKFINKIGKNLGISRFDILTLFYNQTYRKRFINPAGIFKVAAKDLLRERKIEKYDYLIRLIENQNYKYYYDFYSWNENDLKFYEPITTEININEFVKMLGVSPTMLARQLVSRAQEKFNDKIRVAEEIKEKEKRKKEDIAFSKKFRMLGNYNEARTTKVNITELHWDK